MRHHNTPWFVGGLATALFLVTTACESRQTVTTGSEHPPAPSPSSPGQAQSRPDQAQATPSANGTPDKMKTTESKLPPIDVAAPSRTETATFALG